MYQPKFTISSKILKDIGLIEGARAVIGGAALLPAWEAKFKEEAQLRAVHYGTHVEGNELNLEEVKKVMEGQQVVARERDIKEVINFRKVIEYQEKLIAETRDGKRDKKKLYDQEVLKQLHRLTVDGIVPENERGDYRKVSVVLRDVLTGEIVHRPCPFMEVPYQMDDFFEWLNDPSETRDLHPILKAGIVHYAVVNIHPFTEGNGRVSRALATLILLNEGYDIRKLFSLEEHYDKNVAGYYYAIKTADQNPDHDVTQWLEYFVEGVAIEFNRVKEKVEHLSLDLKLKAKAGQQIFLNERQIKLVEYIEDVGYLSNAQFKELLPMVSEDTVLRDLKDLMEKKIIKKKGKTKAARYEIR
ncbi:Fic family protein [Candidatus Microgenomates bacterium]|nr:Fic family protein [Candidatus Microgenomates bacterium]